MSTKLNYTPRGIVVDHKESGVRYAISESNFNPKLHRKVRPLLPTETVHGYQPKVAPKQGASESAADRGGHVSDESPKTPSAEGTPSK